jgi:hypothetical protein
VKVKVSEPGVSDPFTSKGSVAGVFGSHGTGSPVEVFELQPSIRAKSSNPDARSPIVNEFTLNPVVWFEGESTVKLNRNCPVPVPTKHVEVTPSWTKVAGEEHSEFCGPPIVFP